MIHKYTHTHAHTHTPAHAHAHLHTYTHPYIPYTQHNDETNTHACELGSGKRSYSWPPRFQGEKE